MAHNISEVAGKAEVMVVGKPPWHGLGTVLDKPATSTQAIKAAGLDWPVDMRSLFARGEGGVEVEIPNRIALVRPDVFDQKPGSGINPKDGLLGVAGYNYDILQNTEAFSFFDDIVGSKQAIYHTCGALDGGKKVWILAKLPESIAVLKGDDVDKYLLLANGHTGTAGLTIRFTPVRVVCQNTLSQAMNGKGKESVFKTHHGAGLMDRLTKAHVKMGIVTATYARIAEGFQAMAKMKLTKDEMTSYFEQVLPMPGDDQKSKWAEHRRWWSAEGRARMAELAETGRGASIPSVQGSLWGAYNAATEWVDHHAFAVDDPQRHLNAIWFGQGAQLKERAFQAAAKILNPSAN